MEWCWQLIWGVRPACPWRGDRALPSAAVAHGGDQKHEQGKHQEAMAARGRWFMAAN